MYLHKLCEMNIISIQNLDNDITSESNQYTKFIWMDQTKIMFRTQKRVPIISIVKEYECDSVLYQFQEEVGRVIGRFLTYGNEYHCRLYGNCALNTELLRRQLLKMRMSLKITDKRTCLMRIAKRTQLCREHYEIVRG
ncbi:uncharacterized protein LOC113338325 isoform X2 [Papaver somniferum]|uniref:uncharacterized protein LOC113338325 isoform X2 n=1 Tax=Papaver somniferum TaxID=3469 RepID=UPI000E6F4D50|nr:uncharacterized protein LOC113338325 isoform X2 [Papaver somniferum]